MGDDFDRHRPAEIHGVGIRRQVFKGRQNPVAAGREPFKSVVAAYVGTGLTQVDEALSFNGIPERLVIPFDAIKGFFDPSVQFGLQFETITEAQASPAQAANESEAGKTAEAGAGERQSSRPTPRGAASEPEERPATSVPSTRAKKKAAAETPAAEKPAKPSADKSAGAEVVSLDKFRKK